MLASFVHLRVPALVDGLGIIGFPPPTALALLLLRSSSRLAAVVAPLALCWFGAGCCVSKITARWWRWRCPTHISRRRGGVRLIRPVVVAMLPSCSKQVLPAPGELHVLGHRPPTDNLANPAQRVVRARWEAAKPGQGDSACSPLELGGNLLEGGGRGGAHGCNGDREGRGRHGRRRNGLRNTCVRYRGRGE